ncbi:hypothetical protein ACTXT7_003778 [Hymenolepis weldensis]
MVPPSGRFRSVRRRSRSPPGLSARSFPSGRHGPRHLRNSNGSPDVRPKFREQPSFNVRRDFAPRRNSLVQVERGANLGGSYMSRNRGPVNDRPQFDGVERRPPSVIVPPRRFNRNNTPPPVNGFRDFNGGRSSVREHRREDPVDRGRRFLDRGDQQSYRNEVRHHFDNNQTMRDAPRGIRSPYERDHWRSADVAHRRSSPRNKPPRLDNLTPSRYDRSFVDDFRRLRGGHRGTRPFRSGRAAFRSPNRSLLSRR